MAYTSKEQYEKVYYKRKQEYAAYLGGVCVVCGVDSDLEFDHIDWRTKSFTIMKAWGWADQGLVYAELDKCQLLCKLHHKEKTRADQGLIQQKPITHGNMTAWIKKKCQCDVCQRAKREWYDTRNEQRRTGARGPYRPRQAT